MAKFHITDDGPKPCKATKKPCKYGNAGEHFKSQVEAQKAFEARQKTLPDSQRKSGNVAPNRVLGLYEAKKRSERDNKYASDGPRPGPGGSVHRRALDSIAIETNMPIEVVQERLIQGIAERDGVTVGEAREISLRERDERSDNFEIGKAANEEFSRLQNEVYAPIEERLARAEAEGDEVVAEEQRELLGIVNSDAAREARWQESVNIATERVVNSNKD